MPALKILTTVTSRPLATSPCALELTSQVDYNDSGATTRRLLSVLSDSMAPTRARMRAAGLRAFHQHLNIDHNPDGVLTAIMSSDAVDILVANYSQRQAATAAAAATARAAASASTASVASTAATTTPSTTPTPTTGSTTASTTPFVHRASHPHTMSNTKSPTSCLASPAHASGGRTIFIKTHKTASGSIFNVLGRVATRRRLAVALPPSAITSGSGFGRDAFADCIDPAATPPCEPPELAASLRAKAPFDVLIHHTLEIDVHGMSRIVPNAPFVTIVRDPASQFASAWDYYTPMVFTQSNVTIVHASSIASSIASSSAGSGAGSSADPANASFPNATSTTAASANATFVIIPRVNGQVAAAPLVLPISTWAERLQLIATVLSETPDADDVAFVALQTNLDRRFRDPSAVQLGYDRAARGGVRGGAAASLVPTWLASLDATLDLVMVQVRDLPRSHPCLTFAHLFSLPHLDLVMVQERLDDSMWLLGRCLGLAINESLIAPRESDSAKAQEHMPLSAADRAAIREFSAVDTALHQHATARLARQLAATQRAVDGAGGSRRASTEATDAPVAVASVADLARAAAQAAARCTEAAALAEPGGECWQMRLNERRQSRFIMAHGDLDVFAALEPR